MDAHETYVYPAIFEKTATGYSVMFPDLPGCFTVGVGEAHTAHADGGYFYVS